MIAGDSTGKFAHDLERVAGERLDLLGGDGPVAARRRNRALHGEALALNLAGPAGDDGGVRAGFEGGPVLGEASLAVDEQPGRVGRSGER